MRITPIAVALQLMISAHSLAADGEEKGMISMSGQTFRALEIAAKELDRHGLKVEKYRIFVETIDKTIHVTFDDPDRSPTQRGSGPNLTGLSVELDAETLSVTRSTFIK
jgi:hypothetical protein